MRRVAFQSIDYERFNFLDDGEKMQNIFQDPTTQVTLQNHKKKITQTFASLDINNI